MTSPRGLLALVILVLGGVAFAFYYLRMQSEIRVFFSLNLLKTDQSLLDPDNTETVWEYYLLENLSCGLIRDSKTSGSGYEGCIAEKFYQDSPKDWVFHLRNLKWSDGSEVSQAEIQAWIDSLRSANKRHIKFLKLAESVHYDANKRLLKIRFPFPVGTEVIHELSLADATLVPTDFKSQGWARTVGPYSVLQWNPQAWSLILKANPLSPLYREGMPEQVELSFLPDPKEREQLFSRIPVDVAPVTPLSTPDAVKALLPRVSQIFEGHPNQIYFFYFNSESPEARSLEVRELFSRAIRKAQEDTSLLARYSLAPQTQMIPEGFQGRLPSFDYGSAKNATGLSKIKIKFGSPIKNFGPLLESLKNAFLELGVEAEFVFSDSAKFEQGEIASSHIFVGNQLDPSGSWAFLAGPPHGVLSPWVAEFKDEYENAFNIGQNESRKEKFLALHKKILDKRLAIPFFVGRQRYFLSDRVDARRWNAFDSRLRLYELELK